MIDDLVDRQLRGPGPTWVKMLVSAVGLTVMLGPAVIAALPGEPSTVLVVIALAGTFLCGAFAGWLLVLRDASRHKAGRGQKTSLLARIYLQGGALTIIAWMITAIVVVFIATMGLLVLTL